MKKLDTAQIAWDEYIKACHPKLPTDSTQYEELKQAFYAGMYSTLQVLLQVATNITECQAAKYSEMMYDEVKDELNRRRKELLGRTRMN